jgi:hypothetical protein
LLPGASGNWSPAAVGISDRVTLWPDRIKN